MLKNIVNYVYCHMYTNYVQIVVKFYTCMYIDLLKMHEAFWGGVEVADPRVCFSSRSKEHRALSAYARRIIFLFDL